LSPLLTPATTGARQKMVPAVFSRTPVDAGTPPTVCTPPPGHVPPLIPPAATAAGDRAPPRHRHGFWRRSPGPRRSRPAHLFRGPGFFGNGTRYAAWAGANFSRWPSPGYGCGLRRFPGPPARVTRILVGQLPDPGARVSRWIICIRDMREQQVACFRGYRVVGVGLRVPAYNPAGHGWAGVDGLLGCSPSPPVNLVVVFHLPNPRSQHGQGGGGRQGLRVARWC
jgi:hypothetical protein